jgi:hypothetical protein
MTSVSLSVRPRQRKRSGRHGGERDAGRAYRLSTTTTTITRSAHQKKNETKRNNPNG